MKKLAKAGKKGRLTKNSASIQGQKDQPKQYYHEKKEEHSNDQNRITTITSSGGYSLKSKDQ